MLCCSNNNGRFPDCCKLPSHHVDSGILMGFTQDEWLQWARFMRPNWKSAVITMGIEIEFKLNSKSTNGMGPTLY